MKTVYFAQKLKNKLQIYLNRSRYIINYELSNKKVNFDSIKSFIGNNKFIFSGNIFRMYQKYCESQGWKVEIITDRPGDHG